MNVIPVVEDLRTELTPVELDADAIRKLLPHRDVMALLDRIKEYYPEQRVITAIKRIPMNEFSVQGCAPGRLYFPPTLLTECLAQTCGIMMNMEGLQKVGVNLRLLPDKSYRATIPDVPLSVLAESHIKHEFYAVPGDTILLQSKVAMQRGEFRYFHVTALTSSHVLARGTILLSYPPYM